MTEASPAVCFNPPFGVQKEGSIGLPIPYAQCKIVDENDVELPAGEVGELAVRGESVKAFVVLKEGETCTAKELLRYMKERLAVYKLPRVIEFIPSLPKNNTGKIMKRMLIEQ